MKKDDFVFVIDWGKRYQNGYISSNKWFKTEIPQYSGTNFYWKIVTEPNLTLKGKINKTEPTRVIDRIPIWKSFKYEVLEVIKHPNAGEYSQTEKVIRAYPDIGFKYTDKNILLLKSKNGCYVIVQEDGVSKLTPKQHKDKLYNALVGYHTGKYTKDDVIRGKIEGFPDELISTVYHKDDNVLFGSAIVKGKVMYKYIDAKYTKGDKPLYLYVTISYDGKGNCNLPEEATILTQEEMNSFF